MNCTPPLLVSSYFWEEMQILSLDNYGVTLSQAHYLPFQETSANTQFSVEGATGIRTGLSRRLYIKAYISQQSRLHSPTNPILWSAQNCLAHDDHPIFFIIRDRELTIGFGHEY